MNVAKINPIQVQKHLKGVDYPVSKDDLIHQARQHGAEEKICSVLEQLPDKQYESPAEVSKAIGQVE